MVNSASHSLSMSPGLKTLLSNGPSRWIFRMPTIRLFLFEVSTNVLPIRRCGEGNIVFSLSLALLRLRRDLYARLRFFTAYAMMNAAGGADEWRRAGMHPIRRELRSDLAGRLDTTFQREIKSFNQSHGRILEMYELALLTAGQPDFRLSYDPKTTGTIGQLVQSDSGFLELLGEFYGKADVAELWMKYGPLIQAENDKYRPFADMAIADVDSYCRLDSNYFSRSARRIHFQFMPLLPYFASLTARVNGEVYMIVGPQEDKPDKTIFYYYLLRRVAGPLVRSDSSDARRLSGLYDAVKSKIDLRRGNWNTLVAECIAEAIDIRLEETLQFGQFRRQGRSLEGIQIRLHSVSGHL